MADNGPIWRVAVGSVGKRVLESYYTVAAFAVCCDDEICCFVLYHIVDVNWNNWGICGGREYDFGGLGLYGYIGREFMYLGCDDWIIDSEGGLGGREITRTRGGNLYI